MEDIGDYDLRYGDWQVLDAFEDPDSEFGFQGLKRKLGMHQESLVRALRRLESDELVEHTDGGYRLTSRGSALTHGNHPGSMTSQKVLETYLPSDISPNELVSRLKYSWFSSLRWLGYAQNQDHTTLIWVTEDGHSQIKAHITGSRLTVEIETNDHEASNLAIKFAHELVARIIKEYQKAAPQMKNSEIASPTHHPNLS